MVLAANSDYFNALFTCSMREQNLPEIGISAVDGDALEALIEYCYTNTIEITEENVDDMLPAAAMLQFPDVQRTCGTFYENSLSIANCLKTWEITNQYNLNDAKNKALRFALVNFQTVTDSESFVYASPDLLLEMLDSKAMNIDSELDVFIALVKWAQFDAMGRTALFKELLQSIRMDLIKGRVMDLDEEDCYQPEIRQAIQERCALNSMPNQIVSPRSPIGTLYCVHTTQVAWGSKPGTIDTYKFNHDTNEWKKDKELATFGFHKCQLVQGDPVNGRIIIVGFDDHEEISYQVYFIWWWMVEVIPYIMHHN